VGLDSLRDVGEHVAFLEPAGFDHRQGNWFRAGGTISSGVVEGFNGKAKLTTRKAYGFRTAQGIEFALFHAMGRLPEPEITHRFC
jgi:hypothetical protein